MKTIIVEDEILAADRLADLIRSAEPAAIITERFDTVQDTVNFFQSGGTADLIFMDIQLADGKSFEIFTHVDVKIPVIFTTAYDQYALEAFKTNSIDYLLKPVQIEDLQRAIGKYKGLNKSGGPLGESELDAIRQLLRQSAGEYKERIMIKSGNKLQYKPVDSAAYFYADGKAVYMAVRGEGTRYLIDHTLEELEKILNPRFFFRISRKFLVNFNAIAELRGLVSSKLEIKLNQPCEHELVVSRERAADLKVWLDR
jgi:DNA-binding LytR/AlgR family response regulator